MAGSPRCGIVWLKMHENVVEVRVCDALQQGIDTIAQNSPNVISIQMERFRHQRLAYRHVHIVWQIARVVCDLMPGSDAHTLLLFFWGGRSLL